MDYLCKCVKCTSKNPDGTLLSRLIFNRHRKREQFLSIRDDENIDQVEVHDQDFDVEFHENIIENIDDIEDFDDLEIISDNEDDDDDDDIASQDDEEEEEDDNDIDEDEDDNSEDSDSNEDSMQIEDHHIINKEIIECLQLLYLKSLHNFTEAAYNDI